MAIARRDADRHAPCAVLIWAVLLVAAACGPKRLVHVVAPGETLSAIGAAYGVDYRDLARANGISDPNRVVVGRRLAIPRTGERHAHLRRAVDRPPSTAPTAFRWPLDGGTLTSGFGRRGGANHDGIDIAARGGLAIGAAAPGRVIYAGRLRGYGKVVIVDHGGGYASVYAHNADNKVRVGADVSAGEVIATVGQTGQASGPHLHFEIRKDNVARDPLRFLPARPIRAASRRER